GGIERLDHSCTCRDQFGDLLRIRTTRRGRQPIVGRSELPPATRRVPMPRAMLSAPSIVMFIVFLLKVVCYYNIRGVIGNAAWAESQMSSLHGSRREKHAHLCGEVPT